MNYLRQPSHLIMTNCSFIFLGWGISHKGQELAKVRSLYYILKAVRSYWSVLNKGRWHAWMCTCCSEPPHFVWTIKWHFIFSCMRHQMMPLYTCPNSCMLFTEIYVSQTDTSVKAFYLGIPVPVLNQAPKTSVVANRRALSFLGHRLIHVFVLWS